MTGTVPPGYASRIRDLYPDLVLDRLELNSEGLVNDIVIVNGELVCRFPKHDWARELLLHEARVQDLVRGVTGLSLPSFEHLHPDVASYRYIPGVPLTRNLLLRAPAGERSRMVAQILDFLRALHSIPAASLEGADIRASDTNRDRKWWLEFHDALRNDVFPYLMRYQQAFVEDHFAPVVSGDLSLDYEPRLIHGDLAPYHLLTDPDRLHLSGVIDFGTAGIGDPAVDLATLLHAYGESVIGPALGVYPALRSSLDRARFWAGTLELQWSLRAVRQNDREFAVAHIGGARDVLPVGALAFGEGENDAI